MQTRLLSATTCALCAHVVACGQPPEAPPHTHPDQDVVIVYEDMRPDVTPAPDMRPVPDMEAPQPPDMRAPLVLDELGPAGASVTVDYNEDTPFLQFADDLTLAELAEVSKGRELFVADWTGAGGSRPLLDGLGPLANTASCVSCHRSAARVSPLHSNGRVAPSTLIRLAFELDDGSWEHDPTYGPQVQTIGLGDVDAEAQISWREVRARGELTRLELVLVRLAYGPTHPDAVVGVRVAPALIGMGLLDAVSDEMLLEWADPEDRDEDGISGRAHILPDGAIGRFGWKAGQATLRSQTAAAFSQDMGLTTSLFPTTSCTTSQPRCAASPSGGEPEVSDDSLDAITDFLSVLGVAARRKGARFERGRALFHEVGCASCHRPSLTTRDDTKYPLLSAQTFHPYTDLLLHDMGEELADTGEGRAGGSEWRTTPLWTLGLTEAAGGRFLHDGRARTIEEAILWHGGEAQTTRERYEALSREDTDTLLDFIRGI